MLCCFCEARGSQPSAMRLSSRLSSAGPMPTPDPSSIFIFPCVFKFKHLNYRISSVTMAAFSRGLRTFVPQQHYVCSRCLQFSSTSAVRSGHNRWSKIKHDKGAVDAKKNVQRSEFSKSIAFASKSQPSSCFSLFIIANFETVGGGDPNLNPALASVLLAAKKGI